MTKLTVGLAATAAVALLAAPAFAGPFCAGKSQEVSVPTETASTDQSEPVTVAESETTETR
jgi:hypothetical protein